MKLMALALCSLLAIPAPAAEAPGRWDRVSEIPKTQQVKVHLRNGTVLKGTIQETAPEGLALVEGRKVIHINRPGDREDHDEIAHPGRAAGRNRRVRDCRWTLRGGGRRHCG